MRHFSLTRKSNFSYSAPRKESPPRGPGFDYTPQGCEVRAGLFLRGHISKEIPLGIAVTQYLGFLPAIASMSSLRRGGRVRP